MSANLVVPSCDVVRFTPISGQGTRVEVPVSVDEEVFQGVAREAIAAARAQPTIKNKLEKAGTGNQESWQDPWLQQTERESPCDSSGG